MEEICTSEDVLAQIVLRNADLLRNARAALWRPERFGMKGLRMRHSSTPIDTTQEVNKY